ncbi:MAG: hypothetical protein ACRCVV_21980 [Shewanella sp.]
MTAYSLKQLYEDLNYGELSQIDLTGVDSGCECGEFDDLAKRRVISHLNFALIALYTKFPIREKEVTIQLYPHISQYFFDYKYAKSNTESTEIYKYIEDTPSNPFKCDVLRIEDCYDEAGYQLCINSLNEPHSIFTPDYTSIQVPFSGGDFAISVIYRAAPTRIEYGVDESAKVIEVPVYLYEALLYYITYRVHKTRSNQEAQAEALRALQLFDAKCVEVETRNLTQNSVDSTNLLIDTNGWA